MGLPSLSSVYDVCRTPLQGRGAVAGGEQVVDADVRRHLTERGQFAQEFFSVGRVGVVWLIVSKVIPDGRERACGLVGVYPDSDAIGSLLRGRRWSPQQTQHSDGNDAALELFHRAP